MGWWYPHDKPVIYSYTSAFTEKDQLHGSEAEEHIAAEKNLVGTSVSEDGKTGQAIIELNRMINVARSAEQQFLRKYGFSIGNDWNSLITGMNLILGTKESFERNVQLLKQYTNVDDDTNEYEDVARFFKGKLQQAIYEEIDININQSAYIILERAVKNAILKMSKITDTKLENGKIITKNPKDTEQKGQALQAFLELFKIIQVFQGCNFLTRLGDVFKLEDYINEVKKRISQGEKTQLELEYNGKNGNPGSLAEIIYSAIAENLGAGTADGGRIKWNMVEQPGGHNYKTDRYLASINVSYEQSVQNVKNNGKKYGNSIRARGIDSMRDLYQQIGQAKGDIVLISDKNYIINQAFHERKGFKAQESTSLNALNDLFNNLDITGFNIDAMINYLANIGSNLVEKKIDSSIIRAISTQVGNFLFDDLSFRNVPVNANIIHVFNLSGIYVPLSVVLEGVSHGLSNLNGAKLESYVSVKFKSSSDAPEKWTKEKDPWIKFRNAKMQNNKLTIHFLQDFAAIISNAVQL